MFGWRRRRQSRSQRQETPEGLRENQIRLLTNAELREADLPAAIEGWVRFALSFNGYQHCGSFEKCADVAHRAARTENCDTLSMTELRTELFFFLRAVHHSGEEPSPSELARIRVVVDAIGDKIRRREIS